MLFPPGFPSSNLGFYLSLLFIIVIISIALSFLLTLCMYHGRQKLRAAGSARLREIFCLPLLLSVGLGILDFYLLYNKHIKKTYLSILS